MLRYLNGHILFPLLEKISKREVSPKVKELIDFDQKSLDERNELQRKYLYDALIFSRENIPYYQNLFHEISFNPESVLKDIEAIKMLPVLTKEDVLKAGKDLTTNTARHGRKTGGSTGRSVWFYYNNDGLDWTAAINQYSYELCGKKRHHKDCHSSSDLGLKPILLKHKVQQFLKLSAMNRSVLMIEDYSDQKLLDYYKFLKRKSPYLLQAHPSTVFAISRFVEKKKMKPQKIFDVFEPTGETLPPKMVQHIEEFLKCQVVNRYGNAEFGVMAHSFEPHSFNHMKVFDRAFYIEECRDSSLIVSNFTNLGMPLFRYDTGDIGTVSETNEGTILSDIKGRIHDSVEIHSTKIPTHYIMDFLDHKVGGVNEFQVVVSDDENVELRIDSLPEDFERIQKAVLLEWPKGLEVKLVDSNGFIRVGHRNKFKHLADLRGLK